MAVRGLTYIASDSLFAIDDRGNLLGTSAPVGIFTKPVVVGHASAANHRVYLAAQDDAISRFSGAVTLLGTFSAGQPVTWSLTDTNSRLYVGTGAVGTPGQGPWSPSTMQRATWCGRRRCLVRPCGRVPSWGGNPDKLFIGTAEPDFRLRALNVADGAEIWSEPGYVYGQVAFGNVVFYSDIGGNSLCTRSVVDGRLPLQHSNFVNFNFNRPVVGPIAGAAVLFATSLGSQVLALDARTGAVKWTAASSGLLGAPVVALNPHGGIGRVIFANEQSTPNTVEPSS